MNHEDWGDGAAGSRFGGGGVVEATQRCCAALPHQCDHRNRGEAGALGGWGMMLKQTSEAGAG